MNKKETTKKDNKKKDLSKKKEQTKLLKLKKKIVDNKNKLILLILALIDIILIIYVAKDNVANYANVNGEEIFIGQTKNILLGRNYITLVISIFIYLYGLIINKIVLHNKMLKKNLIFIFVGVLVFNMILFCIFTNRVY